MAYYTLFTLSFANINQASFLCTFLNLVKYGKIRKPEFLDFGPEFLDFGPEVFLVDLSFSWADLTFFLNKLEFVHLRQF